MSKITVTQRGIELQNELRRSLESEYPPKIQLEKQETPRRYKFLLKLPQDNVKEWLNTQATSTRSNNSPINNRRATSLQTTRSCFYTEEHQQPSPSVREMRNRSLIQRVKAKERKIEHSVKLNLSNYTGQTEMASFSSKINGSYLSPRNMITSSQMVIEQQKQNLIDNIQRQQQRIYEKYVLTTRKQDMLQEKQKKKYEIQYEQRGQLALQDKARDKFWKNWTQISGVLQHRSAQFEVDKDREIGRLEDYSRQRYLKSFLKLPKCAKNYDKSYNDYKVA